jgi:hypothetical protein
MMSFLILAAYAALSTFQAVVIWSGLVAWTGIPDVAAVPVATLLGLVPGAGTVVAILAAGSAWGWPWFGSTALFCGLLALWAHMALYHGLPALSSPEEE